MGPEKISGLYANNRKRKTLQNIILYSWQLDIKANKTFIQL